ncbi:hypothetical protein HMPREF0973_00018 [Prevotella veroralis F0319]|uniref:Uncharacterized protein n=1 Tax=Prevotella veroralis F0319 TaxID=649761 RepID=C9MKA1_9BACT|nr:hypothetical protein HMPREF0973_00018 [Prevotella veroralis F0319]
MGRTSPPSEGLGEALILNYELCILNYTRASLMRVLFTFFKQKDAF